MIKSDFTSMTKNELRAYLIAHPNDKTAFHAFVDRFTSETVSETFDLPKSTSELEKVDSLIRQKLAQINKKLS